MPDPASEPLPEIPVQSEGGRFDISSFVGRFRNGLSRTNRFKVLITAPPFSGGNTEDFRIISLNCESAELPGRDLTTTDARIYGPTFKMPYMTNYNDVSFTFLCGASLMEKRIFDEWISYINPVDSFNFQYRDSYVTTVSIHQLTDNEITTYSCQLIEAYPIQVNAMPVSWGDENFHRVTVTMTYRYWISGTTREEAEADISSSREEGRTALNDARMRNAQQTVLRNRYGGIDPVDNRFDRRGAKARDDLNRRLSIPGDQAARTPVGVNFAGSIAPDEVNLPPGTFDLPR